MKLPVIEWDLEAGTAVFIDESGSILDTYPVEFPDRRPGIRRFRLDLDRRQLELQLPDGTWVRPWQPGPATRSPVIVYLDQNHWSAMTGLRSGNGRIADSQRSAAQHLTDLADVGQVIFPLSRAHFIETGPLYGQRREDQACTMLALSRGLTMRNPHHLALEEMHSVQAGSPGPAPNPFVTDGSQVFVGGPTSPDVAWAPSPFQATLRRAISLTALFAQLVDREQVPDEGGHEAVSRWGDEHAHVAGLMHTDEASKDLTWRTAHARLLVDVLASLRPPWPPEVVEEFVPRSFTDLSQAPYLSRIRAVMYQRLRANLPWTANDFNDIHFLCCASGYADIVIGEKRTINELARAREVPSGARLSSNLAEGVTVVERLVDASRRAI